MRIFLLELKIKRNTLLYLVQFETQSFEFQNFFQPLLSITPVKDLYAELKPLTIRTGCEK